MCQESLSYLEHCRDHPRTGPRSETQETVILDVRNAVHLRQHTNPTQYVQASHPSHIIVGECLKTIDHVTCMLVQQTRILTADALSCRDENVPCATPPPSTSIILHNSSSISNSSTAQSNAIRLAVPHVLAIRFGRMKYRFHVRFLVLHMRR